MAGDVVTTAPVLVGVDDSEESLEALDWAAAEAALRRCPLRIVTAYLGESFSPSDAPAEGVVQPRDARPLFAAARRVVADAAARARRHHPDLLVTTRVAPGWPVPVLLEESTHARMLVVASRALGPLRDVVLGSVSRPVVQQSACPVVVVRKRPSHTLQNLRVIVGIDRDSSDDALGLAFEEARLWRTGLTVVHTWQATPAVAAHLSWNVDRARRAGEERDWLADQLRPWLPRYPEVDVVRDVVEGEAAPRLVRLSQNARLLVVGSRGRAPLSALVLGSVSMTAAQQAHCPVIVVRRCRPLEDPDLMSVTSATRAP